MEEEEVVKLITPHELGRALNIDHKTVLYWVNEGNLLAFKRERVFRLLPRDVKRFLSEHWTMETEFRAKLAW